MMQPNSVNMLTKEAIYRRAQEEYPELLTLSLQPETFFHTALKNRHGRGPITIQNPAVTSFHPRRERLCSYWFLFYLLEHQAAIENVYAGIPSLSYSISGSVPELYADMVESQKKVLPTEAIRVGKAFFDCVYPLLGYSETFIWYLENSDISAEEQVRYGSERLTEQYDKAIAKQSFSSLDIAARLTKIPVMRQRCCLALALFWGITAIDPYAVSGLKNFFVKSDFPPITPDELIAAECPEIAAVFPVMVDLQIPLATAFDLLDQALAGKNVSLDSLNLPDMVTR